jgi:hypothetical protein
MLQLYEILDINPYDFVIICAVFFVSGTPIYFLQKTQIQA